MKIDVLLVLEYQLDGSCRGYPLAAPEHASHGSVEHVLAELELFLGRFLRDQPPEDVARHAAPSGSRLVAVPAIMRRNDLPGRLRRELPLSVTCVELRQGRADCWGVALPLRHTFYVEAGDSFEETARREIERMIAARSSKPTALLALFPAERYELTAITLDLGRPGQDGAETRLQRRDHERRERAIEFLAQIGRQLAPRVRHGALEGRTRELAQLRALLSAETRRSVALVGPPLSGKTAVFEAWLAEAPATTLVFSLSAAQLIAGMSGFGEWQERVQEVLRAAERADAVLLFDDLAELFSSSRDGQLDIASALAPYVLERRVRVVVEVAPDTLERHRQRYASFSEALQLIRIDALDRHETALVLRARTEYQRTNEPTRPQLDPSAIEVLLDLVDRYLPYSHYPGKAVQLVEELRTAEERPTPDAKPIRLDAQGFLRAFSLRYGIPEQLLRPDMPLPRAEVRAALGRMLIGQDEAVDRVSDAVCAIKAGVQPSTRPLANLLFVGPTGVGKTELARCLARYLFGSERRLTRFDMSEFAGPDAAERLFSGTCSGEGTRSGEGLLTRSVRQEPFCVLLLDEIEKAHHTVFDLLLQVLGEGRLSDSAGRTAHFTNAIIVMTSNIGSAALRPAIGLISRTRVAAAHYRDQVARSFRPELVNRLDAIVPFEALSPAQIETITRLQLDRLARRRGLAERNVALAVSELATQLLAAGGYSAELGARALRRHLDRELVSPLARLLERYSGGAGTVHVRAPGEELPAALERETSAAGLVLALERQRAGAVKSFSAQIERIAALRRQLSRWLALDELVEVRERRDELLGQLNRASAGRSSSSADQERNQHHLRELESVRREHQRLDRLVVNAEQQANALTRCEDRALAELFADEPCADLEADAEQAYEHALSALFYLLVALRRQRDTVTLLLFGYEDGRVQERWLADLLAYAPSRRWSVELHLPSARSEATCEWFGERYWGPPQRADYVLSTLARYRDPVLVRVSGAYAGAQLALEAGVHRQQLDGEPEPAHLLIEHVLQRVDLTPAEWVHRNLTPVRVEAAVVRRVEPSRIIQADQEITLGRDHVPARSGYFAALERVHALQLLRALEAGRDLEELYQERKLRDDETAA